MRIQPTLIETLDKQHPGLRQDVDLMLDAGSFLLPVQVMLKEKWDKEVSVKVISNYKQRRWLPAAQRTQKLLEDREAILAVVKRHGADEFTDGFLLERLTDVMRRGEEVPAAVLLREQREREKLKIEAQKVENEKQSLALDREKFESLKKSAAAILKEESTAAEDAQANGKPFDAAAALRKISAVIGVGGRLEERVELTEA